MPSTRKALAAVGFISSLSGCMALMHGGVPGANMPLRSIVHGKSGLAPMREACMLGGGGLCPGLAAGRDALRGGRGELVPWFKSGATAREKWLAFWLLMWDALSLLDALILTFRPADNLNGYLNGSYGSMTLAMTRQLANAQLGFIAAIALVALKGDEAQIKTMFLILIMTTLGSFRVISNGVKEGTVKAPWRPGWGLAMTTPPIALLSYFAIFF